MPMKKRHELYPYADGSRFAGRPAAEVFAAIARSNTWAGEESLSGTGSSLQQTAVLVEKLPKLLRELGVDNMLDIPCGDFNWMQTVDLSGIQYTGADIVESLVLANRQRYRHLSRRFLHMDLKQDELGAYGLVFCRDCLVHFSIGDIHRALDNIRTSGSRYLMTTTFTGQTENRDIPTGGWRPLNFQLPPFNFPEPVMLLNEKCTEWDGLFGDKSLGVWRVDA